MKDFAVIPLEATGCVFGLQHRKTTDLGSGRDSHVFHLIHVRCELVFPPGRAFSTQARARRALRGFWAGLTRGQRHALAAGSAAEIEAMGESLRPQIMALRKVADVDIVDKS